MQHSMIVSEEKIEEGKVEKRIILVTGICFFSQAAARNFECQHIGVRHSKI